MLYLQNAVQKKKRLTNKKKRELKDYSLNPLL